MPTYEYRCPKCGTEFEEILRITQYADPQGCPSCGTVSNKLVSESSFVLKGDGWPGKDMKVGNQMMKRRKKVGRKQKDHVAPPMTLAPNVGGEQTESWKDAQKLAKSKGKDPSSYTPLVQQEKKRGNA